MKKAVLLPALLLFALLAACGGSGTASRAAGGNGSSVAQIMNDAVQSTADPGVPTEAAAVQTAVPLPSPEELASPDADVDLTQLSSTLVYSEVSRMMYYPDEFVGKTVKMQGSFAVYEGESRNYYACVIADATACCANGIEFLWSGEHEYPGDYPPLGTEITVTGVFELYEEDGYTYSQLADAAVSF